MTEAMDFDKRIARTVAPMIAREIERFTAEYPVAKEKKKRGIWMRAWHSLPKKAQQGRGELLYDGFTEGQPGFAHWCWYVALCIDLYEIVKFGIAVYKPEI